MSIPNASDVPAPSRWIRRVKVFLKLLFRDRFNTESVGELDIVVAMDVVVVVVMVVLVYMYHLAAADEVVYAIFDFLWQHQERGGRVMLGTIEVSRLIKT